MFIVRRSPARVCWHILYNGKYLLETTATKREAEVVRNYYEKLWGQYD